MIKPESFRTSRGHRFPGQVESAQSPTPVVVIIDGYYDDTESDFPDRKSMDIYASNHKIYRLSPVPTHPDDLVGQLVVLKYNADTHHTWSICDTNE